MGTSAMMVGEEKLLKTMTKIMFALTMIYYTWLNWNASMWAFLLELHWGLLHSPDINWDKFCQEAIKSIDIMVERKDDDDEEEGKATVESFKNITARIVVR